MGSDPVELDDRVRRALEACFLAEEAGEDVDVDAICDGDAEVARRVRSLLHSDPLAGSWSVDTAPDEQEDVDGATDAGDQPPRQRLGEYTILRLIGRGGMGRVYLAKQPSLGRRVALKVLDAASLQDPRTGVRFRREAEFAAALNHPNIVPVYGIGEEGGYAYIAMKLLSGPGLDRLERALPVDEVAQLGASVARALEQAHMSGVVHRDIKPANIILDGDIPYIVDFGLARSQVDLSLTSQGTVPGTLPYMAPEVLQSGNAASLDPRVDVYALGATLYELLAGRPPHDAQEPEQLVRQILLQDPPRLSLSGAQRDLETIVLRALEKDQRRRFPSAQAMAEDLERYLAGEPITSRRSGFFSRSLRLAQRHRKTAVVLGALTLVSTVLSTQVVVGRLRDERVLAQGVALARESLGRRDFDGAERTLVGLSPHLQSRDVVATLRTRIRGASAVERLMDAVVRLTDLPVEDRVFARETRDIETHDWRRHRPRIGGLALAIARWHLGDLDAARAHLDRVTAEHGEGRAATAVRLVLDGVEDWPALPDGGDADDHVLVALARRLSGHPFAEQEAELQRALDRDPSHRRAHLARAAALAADWRMREARLVLEGMVRGEETERSVWRSLAYVRSELRDADGVEEILRLIPRDEWTAVDAYRELDVLLMRGDTESFAARLAEHRASWPDDLSLLRAQAELVWAEAEIAGRIGTEGLDSEEAAEALATFRRIAEAAETSTTRDVAVALAFRLEVDVLLGPRVVREAGWEVELERHLADASELLRTTMSRKAQAIILWMRARLAFALGRRADGFSDLKRSIRQEPTLWEPRYEFVRQVRVLTSEPETSNWRRAYLISEARPLSRELIDRVRRGELLIATDYWKTVQESEVWFAAQQNDMVAIRELVPEVLEFHDTLELRGLLDSARAAAVETYGPTAVDQGDR